MNNPLLELKELNKLPSFQAIKAEHVEPALDQVLANNMQEVAALVSKKEAGVDEVLVALENMDNELSKLWSPVSHLNAVMNTDELRQAYTACLPKLSDYQTEIGQNKNLYELISYIESKDNGNSEARQSVITKLLKGFKLSGVDLDESEQKKYKELSSELSRLTSQFSDNVLDATNAWLKHIDAAEALDGLPESAMDMVKSAAKQRELSGYALTLDFPIFNAVMTYAHDRSLREEVYRAYSTRASDQGDKKELDNSHIMVQILQLRAERAALIGFDNFAEQSLFNKMADTPDQVLGFLNDLLNKARPQAIKEIEHLKNFAAEDLGLKDMQPWDLSYVSEKLKNKELEYSEEDIKPWFSVENVLSGLYELVGKLYQCKIIRKEGIDTWHDDVRYYQIYDSADQPIASFYLDLYARQHKRGGAWMGSYTGRFEHDGQKQLPVAYMTCNSSPPAGGKPAQFTHNEVITLFHEFGHGLHHMLTKVDYLDVSGINGVEWDAVELPSQFMENWCWERASLDLFAKHYETGELIPDELYEKMLKTRHYNSAMGMLRQLEFAIFDMRIHMDNDVKTSEQIAAILAEVREQTALLPVPVFNRFQHAFSHIFAGGYAAGYYSYKWAEVLSADAFSKFEENGLFDEATAKAFLQEILEQGGSRPAKESFIAFRGREPDVTALLRHSGIVEH